VDINLAAAVPWRREVLQFVPGLGPRKAQALLQVWGERTGCNMAP
jgi:transcription elongation factor SPT6